MSWIGSLHPLLVHFPIALILAAAAAELVAIRTRDAKWHDLGVANLRSGAALSALTALAGWRFASAPFIDPAPLLSWHAGVGTAASATAIMAALLSIRGLERTGRAAVYRTMLLASAALVALAGHLGGTLVWGTVLAR